jgi:hypothetical protein
MLKARSLMLFAALAPILVLACAPAPGDKAIAQEAAPDDGVIRRGEALTGAPVVPIAGVLAAPGDYTDKTVTIEGAAEKVCEKKGCWMEVVPEAGQPGLRVTFKDYGFFVPTDSAGSKIRAEGQVDLKTWSKKDADHLEGEGARLTRNPDGTATEVGFTATGVEMKG